MSLFRYIAVSLFLAFAVSPAIASPPLLVIGDCIATQAGVGGQFVGARVNARQGAGSAEIIAKAAPDYADTIVSTGSNNFPWTIKAVAIPKAQAATRADLERTRARLTGNVVWILPNHPAAAAVVRQVALLHEDQVVSFKAGRDRVHPANYPALARAIAPLLSKVYPMAAPRRLTHRHR